MDDLTALFRTELAAQIGSLKVDLGAQLATVKTELKTELATVKTELASVKMELAVMKGDGGAVGSGAV